MKAFVISSSKLLLPAVALSVITGCASQTHEDAMRLFVEQMNMTVFQNKTNIQSFLKPQSGVALEGMQEVRPGVTEYAFVDKLTLFVPPEKKCRISVIVQKNTGTMTDWRYNSKPEYCTANR